MQPFTPSRSRAKTVIFSCSCPDGSTGGEIGGATEPYMAMGSIMTGNCILTCEEERPWEVKVNINFKPVLLFLCYSSDLEVEIKAECDKKYGKVVHIAVDANSEGDVFVKFDSVSGGEKALQGLNGRTFNSRTIRASYVVDKIYNSLWGAAASRF